jgi:hypothetical protein
MVNDGLTMYVVRRWFRYPWSESLPQVAVVIVASVNIPAWIQMDKAEPEPVKQGTSLFRSVFRTNATGFLDRSIGKERIWVCY